MEQKMLTVPGLAVRNLRHRRVRTMFLAALVLILSAALFTSRVLTESMKTCIDKTVDRIGADVIVAPGEYESDLSDSLFSGGLCSFYFEKSLMDQVKKTDGIDKISPQLYIASLDAACCSVPVQIVAFEPESDFIVQPWMSGSNVSELKKGQTVVGSKITAKAGDKISFFGQEYEVAGKLEETGTSYDNCAFMNFETAYTLFDSSDQVCNGSYRTAEICFPSDDPDERRSRSERSGEHDQHKDERFRTESLYGKSNVRKSFRYTGTDAVLQRASDRTVVFNGSPGTDLHF